MRRREFLALTAAALPWYLATGLMHAQPLDFSGSWTLDETRSDPMEPLMSLQNVPWAMRKVAEGFDSACVIKQTAATMTVSFDNWIGDFDQVLVFDGKPHTTKNPAGRDTIFSTSWSSDQKTLTSTGPVDVGADKPGTLTEVRTLSEDKQTLTLTVTLMAPDGRSAKANRIYKRNQEP